MARVNDTEVKDIIPKAKLGLTAFIAAANLMVTKLAASDCGGSLTDDELKEIERWLAAHFAAIADPKLAMESESFEGARQVYARGSKDEIGVLSTQFGQMANTLSDGCLSDMDLKKPSFFSIGGEHYDE